MTHEPVTLSPQQLLGLFARHRTLLVAPAIAGAVLAAVVSLVVPRDWHAEQGLLIRSDAAGYSDQRLGKFTDLSEMKTVQETLLELARSRSVVTNVLTRVDGAAPSDQDIEDFRDALRFAPPGGAEFGKTEVFYLGVLDPDREKAVTLVRVLSEQLDQRLRVLRNERAGSMVAEVEKSAAIARELLHRHVETLADFERSVGADLIELRHLTSPNGGQSEFGQKALAIDADRRASIDRRRRNEALLVELDAALADPTRIIATPDALLESQPGLRRLKNGLVDAQLVVARTAGVRTADHPYVAAARRAQQAVQEELVRELPSAIAGVRLELEVAQRREAELAGQVTDLRTRSAALAGQRSRYAELVANVEGQTTVLEAALKQLADAKAHRAGANSASLLAPIDGVETGAHPVGPSRTAVTGAGGLAGLMLGVALVFVLHAPPATPATRPDPAPRATSLGGGKPLDSAPTRPAPAPAPAPATAAPPTGRTAVAAAATDPWAIEQTAPAAAAR
ncbi:MAG: hypothetical protein AAF805_01555 [Planctomycetota bacterium]